MKKFIKVVKCEHLRGCKDTFDTEAFINSNHIEYFSGRDDHCNIRLISGQHIEIKMTIDDFTALIEGLT